MRYVRSLVFVFSAFLVSLSVADDTGPADTPEQQDGSRVLEEVIVTAQKRGEENLLGVAMSITAIQGKDLEQRHVIGMDDYLRYQPGTNYIDRGTGRNSVIIRGISSDPGRGGEITGVYIDDIPVQGLDIYDTGSPDLGLVDIERVEVLRGPQGTLYGAGSMSGTVRTLTRIPAFDVFNGYLSVGGGSTGGYGGTNNGLTAMVNVPLAANRLALRAVAYRFDRSGYVRNVADMDPAKLGAVDEFGGLPGQQLDDRGARVTRGFRVSALWRATDRLQVRFSALGQENDQQGIPTIDPLHGAYQQSRFARLDGRDESMSDELDIHAVTAEYDADNWNLLASAAWTDYRADIDWDVGIFFLDVLEGLETPMWIHQAKDSENRTQEVRWTWDSGSRWRVLLGVFNETRKGYWIDSNHTEAAVDPFEGYFELPEDPHPFDETRKSLFGDAGFDLNESFQLTAGFRRYDMAERDSGGTLKAGVTWRPQSQEKEGDTIVYALWGEGFRPGFAVGDPPERCDVDGDGIIDVSGLQWNNVISDDLSSIEVGYKASLAQGRVTIETAVFDIDWTGLQVDVVLGPPCGYTLPFNAGAARSKGVEFALSAVLGDQVQLDVGASWVNAELNSDSSLGPAGSRLPGSPRFNASMALKYDFGLKDHEAWVRGAVAYVGDYYNNLAEGQPRLGDYAEWNINAGIDEARWSLEIYLNNLTDSDALTWANPIFFPYDRESRLRPRTWGARYTRRFGEY